MKISMGDVFAFILATLIVAAIVFGVRGLLIRTEDVNLMHDQCGALGYQEYQERNGLDFCVTHGLEPQIMILIPDTTATVELPNE